jgi:hypothetical protein
VPRFEADEERPARGALRSLVSVPYVLLAQLIYNIVLVLYALAHVQRLEDRHFFLKTSKVGLFPILEPLKKMNFLSLFSTRQFSLSFLFLGASGLLGRLFWTMSQ